jgi:transposase
LVSTHRRQLIDLPEVKLTVTEHRVEARRCQRCGQINKASFPDQLQAPLQYGPKLKARAVYLLQYKLLPYERTRELLDDWFGYGLSAATLAGFVRECAGKLVRSEAQIKARLKRASVIHVDETGLRVAKRGQYVHVTSTTELTHYSCHVKRGREAMDEISILPQYRGACVHDGWQSYRQYGQCLHSLCGAHLLRELTYLSEASEQEQQWAEPLMRLLLEMKEAAEEARRSGLRQVSRKQAKKFTRRYDELTEGNWREHQVSEARAGPEGEAVIATRQATAVWKQSRNLLLRLRLQRDEVLRFMTGLEVPFDNNQAEVRFVGRKQDLANPGDRPQIERRSLL